MNCQVDIIIIGDSKEGHTALKNLASSKPTIKVAFISREFKSTTTHDYLNVEYIKEEVVFTDYKNRLFGCYLKNGDRIYGTHLIIATGVKYDPLLLKGKPVPYVFNTLADVPKAAKNQPAIVIGKTNADIKFALDVAKKYKYVYFCTEKMSIDDITKATLKKLADTKNIQILPNTSLLKTTLVDGVLRSVELDNYSTVTCSAIYTKTAYVPETTFVSDKLINKTTDGYLVVTSSSQSSLVPKCYAVGTNTEKNTQKMRTNMIEDILADF